MFTTIFYLANKKIYYKNIDFSNNGFNFFTGQTHRNLYFLPPPPLLIYNCYWADEQLDLVDDDDGQLVGVHHVCKPVGHVGHPGGQPVLFLHHSKQGKGLFVEL